MPHPNRLALIAHDNLKPAMVEWAKKNRARLAKYKLIATGTTGSLLKKELGLPVHRFKSGPLGGDQQIGAQIAEGKVSLVVFFMDPLSPHPHDVDVKALLRIATLYNVPMACNRATADVLIAAKGLVPSAK
ncbi:MAG: methylglyoxal synthase [Bdellovibrionales bacterium GWB1_55_8]|nr:MAG: methylglyoxal synthase [Bdellovibrionales bacterium GWB1_55_8]